MNKKSEKLELLSMEIKAGTFKILPVVLPIHHKIEPLNSFYLLNSNYKNCICNKKLKKDELSYRSMKWYSGSSAYMRVYLFLKN